MVIWAGARCGLLVIGAGPGQGVITVTGPVTRHPPVNISRKIYTQPVTAATEAENYVQCSVVTQPAGQQLGGNISFMPDLGLEIPRIKIHFRLHFLF